MKSRGHSDEEIPEFFFAYPEKEHHEPITSSSEQIKLACEKWIEMSADCHTAYIDILNDMKEFSEKGIAFAECMDRIIKKRGRR